MDNKILAVVKKNNESGVLTQIINDLHFLQNTVGGYISPLYIREDIVMILDEEGVFNNNKPNFVLTKYDVEIYGTVVIVGVEDDEFVSLSEEQIEFLSRMNLVDREKEQFTTLSLEVGKPNPFMLDNKREGLSVLFDDTGFLFNISFSNLTTHEINAFKNGTIKIDLVYKNGVILFLFEIEDLIDTSDIAFNINLCHENVKKIIEIEEGKGFACKIVLNDSKTGVIKAMRLISLSHEMSFKLNDCIKHQLQNPISKGVYTQIVNNIQRAYSPTELLRYSISTYQSK